MLGGEGDQFLDQLLVAAFEVELVDDLADAPRGPQLRDERVRVVVALVDELGREVERLLLAADVAGERHLGRAAVVIAADEHDLIAGEQVERAFRIDAVDGRAPSAAAPSTSTVTATSVITGAPILR